VHLQYIVQDVQLGLAHAVNLCKDFVGDDPFCMFLGDNIFQDRMGNLLRGFPHSDAEAIIVLGEVSEPTRFGIAEISEGRIVRVVEKPKEPPSNLAIAGVYLFRSSIFNSISQISPSWRNELEITDAIQHLSPPENPSDPIYLRAGGLMPASQMQLSRRTSLSWVNCRILLRLKTPRRSSGSVTSPRALFWAATRRSSTVLSAARPSSANNVTIRNSFVGPYTSIGDNVVVENSEIDASIVMKDCVIRNIPGRIDSSLLADNSEVTSSATRVPSVHRFILAENSYVQL
jgi:glucose-1-phosphate thymidylyltransferase